jgi:hypothetical protein
VIVAGGTEREPQVRRAVTIEVGENWDRHAA